jgi:hypothetical protein
VNLRVSGLEPCDPPPAYFLTPCRLTLGGRKKLPKSCRKGGAGKLSVSLAPVHSRPGASNLSG